jgi:hypothetical protein
MHVADYNGWRIAVFTRDEHCPPHVHVDGDTWTARFKFTFWHNGVELWDIDPAGSIISSKHQAGLISVIKQSLPRARDCWWRAVGDVCLINKLWVASFASPDCGRGKL